MVDYWKARRDLFALFVVCLVIGCLLVSVGFYQRDILVSGIGILLIGGSALAHQVVIIAHNTQLVNERDREV
jgi:hypothetical protein